MTPRQCTVEIIPEKRFPEIMNAAKAGSDELRESIAKQKRYRNTDKKHEFSQLGGEMAQLTSASDPEEFSRNVIRGYSQALSLLLYHGIAALREKNAKTKISAEVAAEGASGLKLELKEETEKSAQRTIAKQRHEQQSGMKAPDVENTAVRAKKTPQLARTPSPTLGPIPKLSR